MSDRRPPRPRPFAVETLEAREVPAAAATWLVEPFQRGPVAGLPTGWTQWASDSSRPFAVDAAAAGLGDQGRLVSTGTSATTGRAWFTAPFAADVEASAAVFLNSAVPVQLFARGQNLNTPSASYYAVGVGRGGEVELTRVSGGTSTSLGKVKPPDYLSNRWVQVTIRAEGTRVRAYLYRGDTNQYLGADGKWTRQRVAAIDRTDAVVRGGGQVGFARPAAAAGPVAVDSLRVGPPVAAAGPAIVEERFANGPADGLPTGWTQWVQAGQSFRTEGDETLRSDGRTAGAARAWLASPADADVQVSSSLYVDSLVPAGLMARGSNLGTDKPTHYGLTVTRGLEVRITRTVAGVTTTLATVKSKDWLSGIWVQASLAASGTSLRAQVFRADTGEYLKSDGTWGLSPAWAMSVADAAIRGAGRVGLTRGAGYAGQLVFDNFILTTAPTATAKPGTIPTEGDKATSPPPPSDPGPVVPPTVPPTVPPPPPAPPPPPTIPPPATVPPPPTVPPVTGGSGTGTTPASSSLPAVPQHYDWIRLANLAYYGTPMGAFEQGLIRNSIDVVIPNTEYLDDVAAANPATPQFIYTNVSNLYLGLLTDWNEYADRNRVSREAAFYHVTRATPLTGGSASSVPVNRFWGVVRGSDAGGWTNVTGSLQTSGNNLTFAPNGQAVALGYLEKFRELNVQLKSAAAGGWAGVVEYVSAVDANGKPTAWKTLRLNADTTTGFRKSGQLTFDPPKDWVAAALGGTARLFYLRVRTTAAGTAPVAASVLGRDYAAGKTIPAFDASADKDKDGYLNDAEYAKRRAGFDARFVYETRLTYPNYGPHRYATNVADPNFRAWAADYHARTIRTQPLARGFFVDNSTGKLAVDPTGLTESLDGYAADYGSLLGAVNKRLAPLGRWLIANTAGGGTATEAIARNGVSALEEFALRPMSANTVQFEDLAATVAYRLKISGGRAYQILDSLPTNGWDANNPRVQMATLAMYYLVADPKLTMLMLNGGNEPASSWTRHWIEAATYDVGQPTAAWTTFATGADPANKALTYKVYGRKYDNALVLYKPLSYTRGQTGTTADNTATTHRLDGTYRPLNADGSLGRPVTSVTLRNGEGVILVRAR